ncbi:hypothetical protein [Secundilactobacillus mixtipabuli]|uniref:Uncharacterized protein n=1 Tax=Secundilactobacillus mixtipabuli TaxID=1435342 RepID=A0A1Z5I909_9LACO|nr:hypothetical protein [Secundilactobacillus mixtipabuli]GAW98273.1 hypothetical protein IWT30_00217 [Secundilactobacillus mixtipabuli]
MTHRAKWTVISVAIYVVFVICAVVFKLLDPARIGLSWTVFWYVAAAGFMYYFYFKNMAYQEVIYFARQFHLTKADLETMVPDRKATAEVPDPERPGILTPLIQVPLSVTNRLTDALEKRAKAEHVTPFK